MLKKEFVYKLPHVLEAFDEEQLSRDMPKPDLKEVYFDDVKEGDTSLMKVPVTPKIVKLFAMISGDYNPLHVDEEFAKALPPKLFGGKNIAHGILLNSFLSALITLSFGKGVTLLEWKDQKFKRPVKVGDIITAKLEVVRKYTEVVKEKERLFLELKGSILTSSEEGEIEATSCLILVTLFKKSREYKRS
ncbi:MAG: MaoC/PaaZ C-terminal domain-containing protein [Candidatus Bathyarchaeia archaeon]